MMKYFLISISFFMIGSIGLIINRKNIIQVLMSMELILLSVNTNFIIFSNMWSNLTGQIMVFFILTVAAAEAAIGLAIVVIIAKNNKSIAIDDLNRLQG